MVNAATSSSADADAPVYDTPLGRPCLTVGEAEVLSVLKQAGFVAEAFAEILREIQPRRFRAEILNKLQWMAPKLPEIDLKIF